MRERHGLRLGEVQQRRVDPKVVDAERGVDRRLLGANKALAAVGIVGVVHLANAGDQVEAVLGQRGIRCERQEEGVALGTKVSLTRSPMILPMLA